MSVDFSQSYPPSIAEDGKFVVINPSTLTGLPSASTGRFAVLTYNIGTAIGSVSGNSIYVASGTYNTNVTTLTPPAPLQKLEIYNTTSSSTVYFLASATTAGNVTSFGMPIPANTYYTLNAPVATLSLCATTTVNVRVIGYY
jgi:hypothetical protein